MVNLRNIYSHLKEDSQQFGLASALIGLGYQAANKFVDVRRFEIIILKRENLAPFDIRKYSNISSRLATQEDINQMEREGKWQMSQELQSAFLSGDSCLLSFVDGILAGYTWIHTAGHPRLIPGLRISIPNDFGYNYAGFTLPEFRGIGLQPYRHHEILERAEWKDKAGMIGYVECTNWSSKKGQTKSGYQRLGDLMIIGAGDQMSVIFSPELKHLGIERLDA